MFRRRRENAAVLDRLDDVAAIVLHDGIRRSWEVALLRRLAAEAVVLHFELLVES